MNSLKQACFAHNIQIVTVYATLGEKAVSAALEEAEIEVIVTSAPLVESKIPGILKSVGNQVKTVIYAPFENHHKMLEKVDLGVDLYSFHDILDKGRMSKIKSNPNETITVDTIALIMYTSVKIFDVFVQF